MDLNASDNGRTLVARPGEVLSVTLDENPATGYRWSVTSAEGLAPEGDEYLPDRGIGIGGGGVRRLRFRVTGAGEGGLQLEYRREWEVGSPAASGFGLRITAR